MSFANHYRAICLLAYSFRVDLLASEWRANQLIFRWQIVASERKNQLVEKLKINLKWIKKGKKKLRNLGHRVLLCMRPNGRTLPINQCIRILHGLVYHSRHTLLAFAVCTQYNSSAPLNCTALENEREQKWNPKMKNYFSTYVIDFECSTVGQRVVYEWSCSTPRHSRLDRLHCRWTLQWMLESHVISLCFVFCERRN